MAEHPDVRPFDAVLIASFGGPEKPADVVPFLANVTEGKGIPRERLAEVGEHYFQFGGRSPINDLNRAFIAAIEDDLRAHGIDLPVYWGNRNWDPYFAEAARRMVADGIKRPACFVTSAYASYSSCRQYREDLFELAHDFPLEPVKLRPYFNHPGFITPFVDGLRDALADAPADTHVVFVTHSIPGSMEATSGGTAGHGYREQHEIVADVITAELGLTRTSMAFCSRSGPPQMPWLEPDVNDHLRELAGSGVTSVAVVPIGFVSDHMEVLFDLDTQAAETAADLGLRYVRTPTPGVHPAYVAMVRELLLDRAAVERGETITHCVLGPAPARPDHCPVGCCANARSTREALA